MPRTIKRIITASIVLLLPTLQYIAHAQLADPSAQPATSAPVPPASGPVPPTTTATTTATPTPAPAPAPEPAPKLTATLPPTPPDTFTSYFNYLLNNTEQPAWSTRTDLFYDVQQKNTPVFGFETIQPLYEWCENNLFGQGRAGYSSGATVFNLGLGYRYLAPDKNFMLGANMFFDEIYRFTHKRVGLGAEVFTPYVTFRANYYDAYTGQRFVGDNLFQRASAGFDGSIETPVPYLSWMRFTLKGYHWKGDRAQNVNGGLFNFRVYPGRQLEIAVGYANDNSQHTQYFANLNYYFGSPDFIQYSASTPHPWQPFTPQDLEKIHLEKVLRTNQIVFEKTRKGSSYVVLTARTD